MGKSKAAETELSGRDQPRYEGMEKRATTIEPLSQASVAGAAAEAVIDPSALDEFRAIMGEEAEEAVAELISIFLELSPQRLAALRQAMDGGDGEQLWKVAHALKSSSASLGAMRLSALCSELEDMGRDGRLEEAAEKVARAEEEYEKVKRALEDRSNS